MCVLVSVEFQTLLLCMLQGCDASILLDSVEGNSAEKEATPNRSVSGYEIIDEIKAKLEEECPETVSCADILALVAQDAVSYQVCIYEPHTHTYASQ